MPDRPLSPDYLAALLERLNVQPAGGKLPREVIDAQVDLLLTRIAELTGALRGAGSDGTTRLAARLLVADLSLVAAHFRGRTNDIGVALTRALEGIQHGLDGTDPHPEPNDTELSRVR